MTARRYEGRASVMIDGVLITDIAEAVVARPSPFAEAEETVARRERASAILEIAMPPEARSFFEGLRHEVCDYIAALARWADDGGAP